MTEPAAQQAYRVPRSDLDRLYATAEQTQPLRVSSGVIVSIDTEETVTVLLQDEEVPAVVVLGNIYDLAVGDIVEVEQRGDLLVIPDTFTEGSATDSPHIVSDEEPANPEPVQVPIGDSMRDPEAWLFLPPDDQAWAREVDASGLGMRVLQRQTVRVATNLAVVPSAEAGLGTAPYHWHSDTFTGTAAAAAVSQSAAFAKVGTKSVLAQWPAADPLRSNVTLMVGGHTVDQTYSATVWVFVPAGSPDVRLEAVGLATGEATNTKDLWVPLTVTYVANAADVYLAVWNGAAGTASAGGSCYVDALITELGNVPPDYFDGDTLDTATDAYSWDGVTGLSTSGHYVVAAAPAAGDTWNSSTDTWDSVEPLRMWNTGLPDAPGTLWSTSPIDVGAGDDLTLTLTSAWYAGAATTVQLMVAYSALVDALPDPTGWWLVPYGAPVSLGTSPDAIVKVLTGTVPDTIPTADGDVPPVTARVGLRFVNPAGNTDLQLQATALTVQGSWPIGTLWLNPGADQGGLPTAASSYTGSGTVYTLPSTVSVYLPVPNFPKCILTAPPTTGGMCLFFMALSARLLSPSTLAFRIYVDGNGQMLLRNSGPATGGITNSFVGSTLIGMTAIAPGQTIEAALYYTYTSAPATPAEYLQPNAYALFVPLGAYDFGQVGPVEAMPPVSYWDGDSFRPGALDSAVMDLTQMGTTPSPTKNPSATTLTRSASTLTAGQALTLTATVSPSAAGTVSFQRASSAAGPWSTLAAVPLSGSRATYKWATSKGTWYFRAVYNGSPTLASSTSAATAATTIKADTPTTKTVTLNAAWAQAYTGGGGQISGSGRDSAVHQGYYSSTYGNRKSLLGFNPNLPADAEVTKVTLTCTSWAHWYAYAGGTLRVGWHSNTNKPANFTVGSGAAARSAHGVDTGAFTVNLTSWADTAVKRSDFKGIVIGPGASNSTEYYGYSADAAAGKFRLTITYRTYT